jgi:glucose/arabinose dehydrogenase
MSARALTLFAAAALLAACGDRATLPVTAGMGADPQLPAPTKSLLPTVKVAKATPWPDGKLPATAAGTTVKAFATGLDHPRWLHVLPNGDVLVAETNAPKRPLREELLGVRGWIMGKVMTYAGAATPSANRITLLRDADGDGVAETKSVFAENLNSPFGMALVGNELFVANTDALVKLPYNAGDTKAGGPAVKVADLPGGPLNHHWTKGLIASRDGSKLYVSVGSNSNVAEHGMEHEKGRAAIWEFDRASGQGTLYATGLRNPVGMAWQGDVLWTAVNERDELGSDLVPDYALGSHTASLGLASAEGNTLGGAFAPSGMFIGQHGSWNRKPPSGYRVIYVPFAGDKPSGAPVDVLTGFLGEDGVAYGRPVGVAVGKGGALLVADDVGNVVWRVTGTAR